MKKSYLIQRLKKPFKIEDKLKNLQNIFSFGGGLTSGGLSKEAMGLIKNIFRFDYMGSSEFEWGAVPEAIQKIAKSAKNKTLIAFTDKIQYKYEDFNSDINSGVESIYIICNKEHKEEVIKRIEKYAKKSYHYTKELINLNASLSGIEGYFKDIVGWLELDNGYFFFSDENMFNKTCQLFGINKEII